MQMSLVHDASAPPYRQTRCRTMSEHCRKAFQPEFGASRGALVFEIALEPSRLQKEGENPEKGHFYFLRQTLVCTKPWFKRDLTLFGLCFACWYFK